MKFTIFNVIGFISIILLIALESTDKYKILKPFLMVIVFGSVFAHQIKSKPKENTETKFNKKNLYFVYSAIFLFILFFFIFYFLGKK